MNLEVWNFVHSIVPDYCVLYNGAYIQLKGDNGRVYKRLTRKDGMVQSISSHASIHRHPPYRCTFEGGELLIGRNRLGTFFQVERSPLRRNCCRHFLDYLYYKCCRRNVGLNGTSQYTEQNPLIIDCGDAYYIEIEFRSLI
jgi:hypothetical protein